MVFRRNLGFNQLSGALPQQYPPSIQLLDLSNNRFSGLLPEGIKNGNLTDLYLGNNPFTPQELPSWMPQMPQLDTLYLNNASIQGDVSIINQIPKLTSIDLSRNGLGCPSQNISSRIKNCVFNGNLLCPSTLPLNPNCANIPLRCRATPCLVGRNLNPTVVSTGCSSNNITVGNAAKGRLSLSISPCRPAYTMLATAPNLPQGVGVTVSITTLSYEYLRARVYEWDPSTAVNWTITQSTTRSPANPEVIENAYSATLPNNATVRLPFTFFPAEDTIRVFDRNVTVSANTLKVGFEIENWQYPKYRESNAWFGASLRFSWTQAVVFDDTLRSFAEQLEAGADMSQLKLYFPAANTSMFIRLPVLGQTDHEVHLQPRVRIVDQIGFITKAVSGTLDQFEINFLFRVEREMEYDPDLYLLFDAPASAPVSAAEQVANQNVALAVGIAIPVAVVAVGVGVVVVVIIRRRRQADFKERINSVNRKVTKEDESPPAAEDSSMRQRSGAVSNPDPSVRWTRGRVNSTI